MMKNRGRITNIALAADHGGYELKEHCKKIMEERGIAVQDFGTHSEESVDYPDMAKPAVQSVLSGAHERAVLICGTGIGMSMTANRYNGIRGTLCHNEYTAEMARKHNDSNVLIMGGRVTDKETAEKILTVWLDTEFEGGRHKRRIDKIDIPSQTEESRNA